LAENSKELLRCCLSSIHDLTRQYYYRISAEKSIPGSLSYLLSIREVDILEIFKICGFYNEKRGAFLFRVFESLVATSFGSDSILFPRVATQKIPLIKIGVGEHPCRPKAQLKLKDFESRLSKDSLMLLFDKPPQTYTTTTESPVQGSAPATPWTTPAVAAAASPLLRQPSDYSPVNLAQRFKISTSGKPKLVMELICDMDTPQKAPLMREIVKDSSTIFIETNNNQQKYFVHIPKCLTEASAMSQMIKYKFVQEIVNILGGGAENVVGGLHKGVLWLCRRMQDLSGLEFTHSAARAGVTCNSRMSPKATAAMWTDVKLTKTKSMKISSYLFDWFKQPITAKEPDVDALAEKNRVKRKHESYQITSSQKGKK
jgi:hypothetical protein